MKPLVIFPDVFCVPVPLFCVMKHFWQVWWEAVSLHPARRIPTCSALTASSLPSSSLSPSLPPPFLHSLLPLLPLTSLPSLWSLLVHNSLPCLERQSAGKIVFTNTFQGLFKPKGAASGWVFTTHPGPSSSNIAGSFCIIPTGCTGCFNLENRAAVFNGGQAAVVQYAYVSARVE